MSAFDYIALDSKGREKKGVMEGDTARQVRQMLREKGMMPLQINEAASNEQKPDKATRSMRISRRGMGATDLSLFTRQLATLVRAAIPLDEALLAVAQQTEKPRLQSMVYAIRAKVLEGHPLAIGLRQFPRAFPELYCSTVAAGEQSGHLDTVLDRLADYAENRQQLNQKISQATIYPAILTAVALMVIVGLMVLVVPKIVEVFETSGQELPFLTIMMISISRFIQHQFMWLIGGIIALTFLVRFLLSKPDNRYRYHRFLLRIPIIGRLTRGLNTARFARTLSILTSSGVPVLDALRLSGPVVINMPMHEAIKEASNRVREGSSIHQALQRSGLFPPMVLHLIASGESSGNLEDMLDKAATQQERELETIISTFMGLFEPLLIVFMGGIVLVIVLAILMPIINMNDLMK